MNANVVEPTVADVFGDALSAEDERLSVVAPDTETIEALVGSVDDDSPSVRLLATSDTLKTAMSDFLLASRAADRIEAGQLDIRVSSEGSNALLLTETSVVALVRADDRVAGLTADDESFIESANERFATAWSDADTYSLRTPSLARVRETLEAELGTDTTEDFESVIDSLGSVRGDDGLDEVEVSLLVAARNDELLYDVSKWGEDIGIASKATFSRTKTRMEDADILDTEKVPIEVGRPRLRLKLATDRLEAAEPDRLAELTLSLLER